MPPIRSVTSETIPDKFPGDGHECRVSAGSDPVSWKFSQELRKQFFIRLCLFLACIVAIPLDSYRQGLNFGTIGAISSTILFLLALPILFFRTLFSVIRMIRYQTSRKLPKKHLSVILLFPLACIAPRILPIPSLVDGATHTLKELDRSDQMVVVVAEELAKPRDRTDSHEKGKERKERLLATVPFSSLNLKYADLRILNDSQLFEFGGPLANRWGFSVSGIRGQSPAIPANCFNFRSVSKEIVVFEGPAD